jgi:hypothetical protein
LFKDIVSTTKIIIFVVDTVWFWALKPCGTRYGERGSWNK